MAGDIPPRRPGDGWHGPAGPHRARSAAWRRRCVRARQRLGALPAWMQVLLWLAGGPVVAAVYAGSSRRLGPLAAPLTAGMLLLGGPAWWATVADGRLPAGAGVTEAGRPGETAPAGSLGPVALADAGAATPGRLPEFATDTLDVEIAGCVQTRSPSSVRDGTIRQPRVVVRLVNRGPERTAVLQAGVLLDGYEWNGGWKPTGRTSVDLPPGQTAEVTLLTDYRHQSSYSPDGLLACRLLLLEVVAPQVWPDYPARRRLPVDTAAVPGSERDFDPRRDLPRPDAR